MFSHDVFYLPQPIFLWHILPDNNGLSEVIDGSKNDISKGINVSFVYVLNAGFIIQVFGVFRLY